MSDEMTLNVHCPGVLMCPRCGGTLVRDHLDPDPEAVKCISCGYTGPTYTPETKTPLNCSGIGQLPVSKVRTRKTSRGVCPSCLRTETLTLNGLLGSHYGRRVEHDNAVQRAEG